MSNMIEFIRKIVLASDIPFDLREEALNLLIKNSYSYSITPGGVVFQDVAIRFLSMTDGQELVRFVNISRQTYNQASDFIRAGNKINAIKAIRNETKIKLVEAKDAVDNWDFNL